MKKIFKKMHALMITFVFIFSLFLGANVTNAASYNFNNLTSSVSSTYTENYSYFGNQNMLPFNFFYVAVLPESSVLPYQYTSDNNYYQQQPYNYGYNSYSHYDYVAPTYSYDYNNLPKTNNFNSNNNEPNANTNSPRRITDDSAELRGDVDMNDFDNGTVFFVYGEDEDQIDDIQRDYDSYNDVDEDGDDLQKEKVDSDLDSYDSYIEKINALDRNTDYYYRICVSYEDDNNDDVLECGTVEHFETD